MLSLEIAALVLHVLSIGGVALVLYQFKRHRRFIGSLHSDMQKPHITPELVAAWKSRIKELTPGTPKHRAYVASLKNVGEWDGD